MSRYRITVNQAAIAENRPALHVYDTRTGVRLNYGGSLVLHDAKIVQGEQQQDGSRVWIECAAFQFQEGSDGEG